MRQEIISFALKLLRVFNTIQLPVSSLRRLFQFHIFHAVIETLKLNNILCVKMYEIFTIYVFI